MKKSLIMLCFAAAFLPSYSQAAGVSAVQDGNYSSAEGAGAVAVGMHSHADANLATAVGAHSKAEGVTSQAFGSAAYAKGYSSTAIGKGTLAAGSASTAVGAHATAIGNSSAAMALHSKAEGGQSTAVGQSSHAKGDQSTAIGSGAITEARFTTALGTNAKANNYLDVAVGSGSETEQAVGTATAEIEGVKYGVFAGHRPTSTVSVGKKGFERTVTNVAAGRITAESTDAVNGSQLFAVGKKVNENADAIAENGNKITIGEQQISHLNKFAEASNSWNVAQDEAIKSSINYTASVDEKHMAMNDSVKSLVRDNSERINSLNELVSGINGEQAKFRQELHDARRESRAGVAGAIAIAGLMQPYEAGQTAVSVGAGTFRNEAAVAIGASRITSGGKWGFKGGAFMDTRKNWGAGLSMAYFFGGVKRVQPQPVIIQQQVVREVVVREVAAAPEGKKIRQ